MESQDLQTGLRCADSADAAPSLKESWRPGGDSNPRTTPASEVRHRDDRSLLIAKGAGREPAFPSPEIQRATPSSNEGHTRPDPRGPLRRVVETFNDPETGAQKERLECGHVIHRKQDAFGYTTATRRRCRFCAQTVRDSEVPEIQTPARECDCPVNFGTDLSPHDKHHLIRCAHVDGFAIALIHMYDEFVVQRDETEEEKKLPVDDVVTVLWRGTSEADALAAFYRAEVELLGREPTFAERITADLDACTDCTAEHACDRHYLARKFS